MYVVQYRKMQWKNCEKNSSRTPKRIMKKKFEKDFSPECKKVQFCQLRRIFFGHIPKKVNSKSKISEIVKEKAKIFPQTRWIQFSQPCHCFCAQSSENFCSNSFVVRHFLMFVICEWKFKVELNLSLLSRFLACYELSVTSCGAPNYLKVPRLSRENLLVYILIFGCSPSFPSDFFAKKIWKSSSFF